MRSRDNAKRRFLRCVCPSDPFKCLSAWNSRILFTFLFIVFCVETPQGRLRSKELVSSSLSHKLVGSFIATYPRISDDPKQSHKMPGGNVIQRLLALLYHWARCFISLNGFQSRLTVGANTKVFLWSLRLAYAQA
jgi:hypothetical protein